MAPVVSKVAKPRPRKSQDLLLIATTRIRPALDELLAILGTLPAVARESLEECRQGLLQVGAVVDHIARKSGDVLSRCFPCDFRRFLKGDPGPLHGNLPVFFVLHIIVMLYNAFVFCYMPAVGLAMNSPTSLIFHAFIFLTLSSMCQAVCTDPGTVPQTEKWRSYGQPPEEATERKRSTGEARWCQNSKAYKPDRAHYCRGSHRVVLRMDHYCPWLGNTIGYANHKFFFLFLLYATALCGGLGVSFLQLLVSATLPALSTFLIIGAEGLTLLLFSILGPFLLFHSYLLAKNTTTIEFCDKETCQSPYDVGIYRNLCSVLGDNPLLWAIPVCGPTGDGLTFARRTLCPETGEDTGDCRDSHAPDLEAAADNTAAAAKALFATGPLAAESSTTEAVSVERAPEPEDPAFTTFAERQARFGKSTKADAPEADAPEVAEALEAGATKEVAAEAVVVEAAPCDLATPAPAPPQVELPTSAFISAMSSSSAWRFAAEITDDFKVGCQTLREGAEGACHSVTKGTQVLGLFAQGTLVDAVSRFSSVCFTGKQSASEASSGKPKKKSSKSSCKSQKSSCKPQKSRLSDTGLSDISTALISESDQASTAAFSSVPASGSDGSS